MAHNTIKSGYSQLVDRLNYFPQGAPPSELLKKILKILLSEKEADLISQLPIKPFTAEKAGNIWKMSLANAQKILDELAGKAILLDVTKMGKSVYTLPPPMAGFFEFSLMRVRGDIDQKLLSELFHKYLHEEDDFVLELFTKGETQFGRTFVHEPVLSNDNVLHVLDYERASKIIETSRYMAVGSCYCRHKMMHLGKACNAPMEICMTFNNVAKSLTKHGHARQIDKVEGLDLLQLANDNNLVQFGENVKNNVSFICNCCGCCCEAMGAARRFALLNPVHTTNFVPIVHSENCNGCGKCVNICPVEAMALVSANNPQHTKMKVAKLDEDICLGCGLCVRACSKDNIILKIRSQRVITPINGAHRVVAMAIERGKLQHLFFDNKTLVSHRALAAILGVILKLPPIKQVLASKQIKSRYIEYLIERKRKSS